MMRVQRERKPSIANAEHSEYFFFDQHYALSVLYCQKIGYAAATAIPRLVGAVCPPEEEDDGEPHAAHKLVLFSRARCPGPEHCADPLIFRSLLLPSDKPDDDQVVREKPRFGPCWKMCRCEMDSKAKQAAYIDNHRKLFLAILSCARAAAMTGCLCSGCLYNWLPVLGLPL